MLKLKKIFSLVFAVAALGLLASSCVEPVDYWTVSITSGDANTQVGGKPARPGAYGAGTSYTEGSDVTIKAGTAPSGQVFYQWTSSPAVNFDDPSDPNTFFTMPASHVQVTAWFIDSGTPPNVRYTWEAVEQSKIHSIATDVKYWKEVDFGAPDYKVGLDNTDVPLYSGSKKLPNNLYKSSDPATYGNKSKYFDIDADSYTAICSVEDADGIFDIVANYTITVNKATAVADGADKWFEVAFDIIDYIDYYGTPEGEGDLGWYPDEYDNPNTAPRLEKSIDKKFVKKYTSKKVTAAGTIDITYYVLHRAKK